MLKCRAFVTLDDVANFSTSELRKEVLPTAVVLNIFILYNLIQAKMSLCHVLTCLLPSIQCPLHTSGRSGIEEGGTLLLYLFLFPFPHTFLH